ncbi:hypothetical protein AYL99_11884 [Fonsecaea erecta]|uniref:Uncharacterized protein n=1 Tax=Fonsecaea erecta TaxID=1367422 RepID=A0A178Z247_9EURO|nr:hypothetical protein AYL99_11884 [Fonsecaea erecta]OAP53862.1 hypothetical protein AYL99_11884 [Fonsecaea erecta]
MGKHGIGKPYTQMRNAMMMGTLVIKDWKSIRMTASLYQREIDSAKYGRDSSRVTAVETLMKRTDKCFAVVSSGTGVEIKMIPVMEAMANGLPDTKMRYVTSAVSPVDLLERAVLVVSAVEELDNITFTDEERLAVAVVFAFSSRKTVEVISDDMFGVIRALQVDWSTDISSLLGAIAIGNMCKFAPFASSRPGARACQERDEALISY